ncbi:hypothetical protein I204_07903 [Kwoniella mangroviensis CBS 8886]|uniref:uncharacterized protein n=1 Tax=Kwoniella mangroviensis CBS 8507 TaxID=1296122 RepID=UPI00080D096A|nr:uncharacterized protein I203_01736 [Kwoniella mangroviensis CBS 8507]OCF69872.1 hypothetical protein I203_01736 [Kwoniella mangroviensis CBS 8507]OCF71276.1 hypothetical protein I204_07903 [Kwoniella mangroviensis CBS 8886]
MPRSPMSPISTAFTTSTNLSPPFTYSTTRPPTSFSELSTRNRSNINSSSSRSRSRSKSYSTTNGRSGSGYTRSPYAPPETPLPPIPTPSAAKNPFDDDSETASELYHRSDWLSTAGGGGADDESIRSRFPRSRQYSRTSYKPSSRPLNSLPPDTPLKYGSEGLTSPNPNTHLTPCPYTGKTTAKVQFADEQSHVIDSPGEITPTPGSNKHKNRSLPGTSYPSIGPLGNEREGRKGKNSRQSTLPSVLSLSHLTPYQPTVANPAPQLHKEGVGAIGDWKTSSPDIPGSDDFLSSKQVIDPFSHRNLHHSENGEPVQQEMHQRVPYSKSVTPDIHKQQTRLIGPKDQNKLGRMSVAPARYTLPPLRKSRLDTGSSDPSTYPDSTNPHPKSKSTKSPSLSSIRQRTSISSHLQHSPLVKFYMTYRPFISPILSLICALVLTVTHSINSDSPIGNFLLVYKEVFDISRAGGTDVALGAWGWCQIKTGGPDPQCQGYSFRDFGNDILTFTIPGNSSLDSLSSLLTALTVLTWLLAFYQIVTGFLHFYLFFALSIPFNHLVECNLPPCPPINKNKDKSKKKKKNEKSTGFGSNSGMEKDPIVAEVDLRVKCERFPYEGYLWVWWAWWGHRRSPIGWGFANILGVLGIATFAMTYKFKNDILNATGSDSSKVKFDHGAYMPPMTVLFTLDTFILSFIYFWNFKRNFYILLNPPSPSPRVLLLPASENTVLQHHRQTGIQSFFAPISAVHPATTKERMVDTYLDPTTTTGGEVALNLDEETIRWLRAYPSDEELLPLIADLRKGKYHTHPHFLLSDIGLLYLRPPPGGDEEESALLVPPKGVIRLELLQDAHLDYHPHEGGTLDDRGLEAHNGLEIMIQSLNQNFWWNGMEIDCKEFIENCQFCFERLREENGRLNKVFQMD